MLAMKDVFMSEPTTALCRTCCGSWHKKQREQ
jgi:hypothetical protein